METLLGEVWTHSSALSDDIKMLWVHTTGVFVLRGPSSLFWYQIPPNSECEMNVETLYIFGVSATLKRHKHTYIIWKGLIVEVCMKTKIVVKLQINNDNQ